VEHGIHQGAVLFAYDGSEYAKAAIREAARQLRPAGRHAVVLTVWEELEYYSSGGVPGVAAPPELAERAESEARELAEEGTELAWSVGFHAVPRVQRGDPVWDRVLQAAGDVDASLVVLGSHGRTGVRLLLMGSVAAAIARHTQRSVLIVHVPSDGQETG
jgi:nucleotide-binding universal stress UspA family protein